jgi:hypothetical protein
MTWLHIIQDGLPSAVASFAEPLSFVVIEEFKRAAFFTDAIFSFGGYSVSFDFGFFFFDLNGFCDCLE